MMIEIGPNLLVAITGISSASAISIAVYAFFKFLSAIGVAERSQTKEKDEKHD
jgi:L-cystine uptake protein TcyP (sodium:dicarboxylate symporter family)